MYKPESKYSSPTRTLERDSVLKSCARSTFSPAHVRVSDSNPAGTDEHSAGQQTRHRRLAKCLVLSTLPGSLEERLEALDINVDKEEDPQIIHDGMIKAVEWDAASHVLDIFDTMHS